MNEHTLHPERIGDETGVLAAGATEADERVRRGVVAARDGDLLDGVGHVVDSDGEEAAGNLSRFVSPARRALDVARKGGETLRHRLCVERLVAIRPEHSREKS